MDILSNICDWVKSHKKSTGAIVGVVLLIVLMVAANNHAKQKQLEQQKAETAKIAKDNEVQDKDRSYVEGTDAYLMSMQPELRKSFGTPPKGFIWDLNGKGISLGDKSKSSEDVLYSYIRALSTLDLATAQKYSRDAKVVTITSPKQMQTKRIIKNSLCVICINWLLLLWRLLVLSLVQNLQATNQYIL